MTNQILLFLIALSVLAGVLMMWVRRSDRRRQFIQQRLHAITVGKDDNQPDPQLSIHRTRTASFWGKMLPQTLRTRLDAAFEATGNRIGVLHLLIAGSIAGVIVFAFTSRILALNTTLVMALGILAAGVVPVLFLRIMQSRYQILFLDVFPDALDLVGRGVRAGLPVNEALTVAGREIADPVGKELRTTTEQVQIGVQMTDALQQTADRVRVNDFRFMVVALALQQKTGGSLAETLANLSKVIRARKALRLKARALSAEARASAMVLAALPFFVGGAMYAMNRDLVEVLFTDPRGRFMVGVAALSLLSGLTTMYVMVKRAVR